MDKEIEGSLAHDLTVSNPIADQVGGSHQHHASGSSEDSSAEDVPLRLSSTTSNGGSHHHHANHNNHNHVHHVQHDSVELGNNFQKQVSTSDDHLLRQVRVLQFCLALLAIVAVIRKFTLKTLFDMRSVPLFYFLRPAVILANRALVK